MRLDWDRVYRDFTACATDDDCGLLCRRDARAIAACCDTRRLPLVVFTDELAWARSQTACWRGKRPQGPTEKRAVATWAEHIRPARCAHPRHCDRPHRSVTCRFFPLEPYFDAHGRFAGLTYIYGAERICPLIGRQMDLRQDFVNQSIAVWEQILAVYPDERTCYQKASRQLRNRFARRGRTLRIFRQTA